MDSLELKEYIKNNVLITDGAMNTFYKDITSSNIKTCELANIYDNETIYTIHQKYIKAGAKLIRTNTFQANTVFLNENIETVKNIIKIGYETAVKAANKDIFIGASIGPIPFYDSEEFIMNEYKEIINTFLDAGADIFVFETFNNLDYVTKAAEYIKQLKPSSFILAQFALTDTGITKKSISYLKIISELDKNENIDAFGFNCGIGPMHLYNLLKKIDLPKKYISALPNAGYPEMINDKIEYVMSPKYFAEIVSNICSLGVKILGGCCGTTPLHIELLTKKINKTQNNNNIIRNKQKVESSVVTLTNKNKFHENIDNSKFIFAVELDPPFNTSIDKLIKGASELKKIGVDIITIADSPMGKSRADSIIVASKIRREIGIETLPHICCRDRNSISLHSSFLGAYMEGIRNFLIVTGDHIPENLKLDTKSVFNLNSYSLIEMLNEMNKNVFFDDPVKIGGALNLNVKNKNYEYERMLKKVECGASFFLTQPVFTDDTIKFLSDISRKRNYKIFAGIMPLVTYANVQFINNELPGITIPDEYCNMFNPDMTREEAEKTGINIAVKIAEKVKSYVDGLYIITPFNRYEMIIKIIDKIKEL